MAFIKTFVESHNDQGGLSIEELQRLHIVDPDPKNPSQSLTTPTQFVAPLDGSRTGPGLGQTQPLRVDLDASDISSGYIYADQPEATVYLRKKQWRSEEWTYTTHSEIEREGKTEQVSVRSLLSRIITRKIEWMGMHEHFTRAQDALDALQAIVPRSDLEGQSYQELVGEANVTDLINDVANTLLPIEFAPGASEKAPVTRYYIEKGTQEGTYQFNGIIELNNVTNISTSLNVSGDGTASLTLENPSNIFYISSSDIDLAMSEDPYLESGDFVGNSYADAPENRPEVLGNLVYFRGRYYPASALNRFFGVRNSEDEPAIGVNRAKDVSEAITDRITDTKRKDEIRGLLRKYFLGKYVFEVFDHVWIWLTSPSKTIFSVPLRNQGQTIQVMQSPDRGPIAELQRVEAQLLTATGDAKTALEARKTQLTKQLKGLKLAEIQQNTVGSAIEFQRYQQSLEQGLPIDGSFPGMQEQQYQVFEGLITGVSESYSDGKYQLQLSCKDVMHYLSLSRIMIKPSLRGTASEAPKGFLNNPIWRTRDVAGLPADSGIKAGQWKSGSFVTYDEFLFGNVNRNQQQSNIFKAPAARQKTPVAQGVADHGVFLSTQPFAGVDAANVISFLVTGIPYNFDTFMRSGLEFGRLFVSQSSGEDSIPGVTDGYFAMLRRQVSGAAGEKGQNAHLGDFKPFTTIIGDEESTRGVFEKDQEELQAASTELIAAINGLTSLSAEEKRRVEDQVNSRRAVLPLFELSSGNNNFTTTNPPETGKVPLTFRPLIVELDQLKQRVYGFGEFIDYSAQTEAIARAREQQRVEGGDINAIVKNAISANPLEATKAAIVSNTDENLLVIDAHYSANVNIQAFNRELASSQSAFSMWQSEYDTPLTSCQKAAEALDFEFFANSQGHLVFKPQTYNRVLKEHLIAFQDIDPDIRAAVAARYAGANGRKFEDLVRKNSLLETAIDSYISALQRLRAQNIERFNSLAHPDRVTALTPKALVDINVDILKRGIDTSEDVGGITAASFKATLDDVQEQIGQILNDSNLTSEQQYEKSVQLNTATVLKLEEFLNVIGVVVREQRAKIEKEVFEEPENAIIVDENRIHIITDGDIVSSSFNEQPPKFTRLDVQGQPDLVNLAEAGETYYWAGGVDYDLWRSYGFLQETRTKPQFHSGPACAPYCRALLGRQWGKIFTGSISVRGDSKYRLGDCVFIESRDMYYYVEGVQHSFTYGSGYSTSLTLTYGRRRGWYIPHPFDVLGSLVSSSSSSLYEEYKQRNIRGDLLELTEDEVQENVAATSPNTVVPAQGGQVSTPGTQSQRVTIFRRADIRPSLVVEGDVTLATATASPDVALEVGIVVLRFFGEQAVQGESTGSRTVIFADSILHEDISVKDIDSMVQVAQLRAGGNVSYSLQLTEEEALDIKIKAGALLDEGRQAGQEEGFFDSVTNFFWGD